MQIYIATSDATSHILTAFAFLLDKYAPGIERVNVLGYSQFPVLPARYNCISLAEKQDGLNSWSANLYKYFRDKKNDYVIFGLDDFLFRREIDYDILHEAVLMILSNEVQRFEFGVGDNWHINEKVYRKYSDYLIYKYGNKANDIPTEHWNYKVNTQFSVWDRETLLRYLNHNRTPAEFEILGSREALKENLSVMASYGRTAFDYVHSGISNKFPGMVNVYGIEPDVVDEMIQTGILHPGKIHRTLECQPYTPRQ